MQHDLYPQVIVYRGCAPVLLLMVGARYRRTSCSASDDAVGALLLLGTAEDHDGVELYAIPHLGRGGTEVVDLYGRPSFRGHLVQYGFELGSNST